MIRRHGLEDSSRETTPEGALTVWGPGAAACSSTSHPRGDEDVIATQAFVVHAQTTAGCGYARYPRGRSVPALKNPSSNAPGEPEAQN